MTDDSDAGDEVAGLPWYERERVRYEEYDRERQERIDRRNAASWKVVGGLVAAALTVLAYDSWREALMARRESRPWLYPTGVATVCTLAVLILIAYALRRWRSTRGTRHRTGRPSSDIAPEKPH